MQLQQLCKQHSFSGSAKPCLFRPLQGSSTVHLPLSSQAAVWSTLGGLVAVAALDDQQHGGTDLTGSSSRSKKAAGSATNEGPSRMWHVRRQADAGSGSYLSSYPAALSSSSNGGDGRNNSSSSSAAQAVDTVLQDASTLAALCQDATTGVIAEQLQQDQQLSHQQSADSVQQHTSADPIQQQPGTSKGAFTMLDTGNADADYMLTDRRMSNARASTSGNDDNYSRQDNRSNRSNPAWKGAGSTGQPARQIAEQQRRRQHDLQKDVPTEMDAMPDMLLQMQRGPATNFKDSRFEMALSRWIKEAPDWFKVRTVFERFGWRFNIVNLSCTLNKLADLVVPIRNRPMLRTEELALKAFTTKVLQQTGRMLPAVDAGTAVSILLSLARLNGAGKESHQSREVIATVMERMRPHLSTLQPDQLAGAFWALRRLKHSPSDEWCAAMFEQTHQLVQQLKAEKLALLLWGLSGVHPKQPPQPWVSTVLLCAERLLDDMEPKYQAMVLMALGGMKVKPHRSWMDAALSAVYSKFDQFGPQALSNVMWALALMGCMPSRSWLAAYFITTLQLLNSYNSQELSLDVWSFSKQRIEPNDEWLDEYFDQSEAKLARFTLRDLALCGYSLAKLGLRPPQTWLRRYCTELLRNKAGLKKNKALLRQVLVALDSFKVPRMDVWRQELYAAAGYKLYKYPNWRQRIKAQPKRSLYSMWPYTSSRRSKYGCRRPRSSSSSSSVVSGGSSSPNLRGTATLPPVLRSGDWGVMDGLGGSRGVLGSMTGSYDDLDELLSNAAGITSSTDGNSSMPIAGSSANGSSSAAVSVVVGSVDAAVDSMASTISHPAAVRAQRNSSPAPVTVGPASSWPRRRLLQADGLVKPTRPGRALGSQATSPRTRPEQRLNSTEETSAAEQSAGLQATHGQE